MAAAATGPRGRPQRRHRVARRRGLRAARLLRLRHRHADVRRPRRRRPALQQLPHHRAVLADSSLPAHRSQPPPQRDGPHRRVRLRVPGLRRHDAEVQRVPLGGARPPRLRDLRRREVAPGAGDRDGDGCAARAVAARARVRPVLRLPRRRDRPVPPRPRARQPSGRPAAHAGGGLPPVGGSGRPGHRLPRRPARLLTGPAVLPLLRARAPATRRTTFPPPYRDRYRGRFDQGWDRVARGGLRPPAGQRAVAAGNAAERAAGRGCRRGTRSATTSAGCTPG